MNRFGKFLTTDRYPRLGIASAFVLIAVAIFLWFKIATDHNAKSIYFAAAMCTIFGVLNLWKRRAVFWKKNS